MRRARSQRVWAVQRRKRERERGGRGCSGKVKAQRGMTHMKALSSPGSGSLSMLNMSASTGPSSSPLPMGPIARFSGSRLTFVLNVTPRALPKPPVRPGKNAGVLACTIPLIASRIAGDGGSTAPAVKPRLRRLRPFAPGVSGFTETAAAAEEEEDADFIADVVVGAATQDDAAAPAAPCAPIFSLVTPAEGTSILAMARASLVSFPYKRRTGGGG